MTLLKTFLEIVSGWHAVFPQKRSSMRAIRQALGSLVCLGRRTVSRIIWTNGGEQRSWGAEYFLHSHCRWQPQQLFTPILERALPFARDATLELPPMTRDCTRRGAASSKPFSSAIRSRHPSMSI